MLKNLSAVVDDKAHAYRYMQLTKVLSCHPKFLNIWNKRYAKVCFLNYYACFY